MFKSLCSFCLQVGPRLTQRYILRRNDKEGLMPQIKYIFIVIKSEGAGRERIRQDSNSRTGPKKKKDSISNQR